MFFILSQVLNRFSNNIFHQDPQKQLVYIHEVDMKMSFFNGLHFRSDKA